MMNIKKEQTQEHLQKMPICNMKSSNGAEGIAKFIDGVYKVVNTQTEEVYIYKSIDELFLAGWSID